MNITDTNAKLRHFDLYSLMALIATFELEPSNSWLFLWFSQLEDFVITLFFAYQSSLGKVHRGDIIHNQPRFSETISFGVKFVVKAVFTRCQDDFSNIRTGVLRCHRFVPRLRLSRDFCITLPKKNLRSWSKSKLLRRFATSFVKIKNWKSIKFRLLERKFAWSFEIKQFLTFSLFIR